MFWIDGSSAAGAGCIINLSNAIFLFHNIKAIFLPAPACNLYDL